jgi:hypothetical protein
MAFSQETKRKPTKEKKEVKCRNPHFPDANASRSQKPRHMLRKVFIPDTTSCEKVVTHVQPFNCTPASS